MVVQDDVDMIRSEQRRRCDVGEDIVLCRCRGFPVDRCEPLSMLAVRGPPIMQLSTGLVGKTVNILGEHLNVLP